MRRLVREAAGANAGALGELAAGRAVRITPFLASQLGLGLLGLGLLAVRRTRLRPARRRRSISSQLRRRLGGLLLLLLREDRSRAAVRELVLHRRGGARVDARLEEIKVIV